MARVSMEGSIISAGFDSGDRVVVGHWSKTPLGPLTDVMWADPDGVRTLFVPSHEAAEFIGGVYAFDRTVVTPFHVDATDDRLRLRFADRTVEFEARRGISVPIHRPAWFTRFVEGPIARWLLGVETYGTSPTGVREWYRASRWRPLRQARASVAGQWLGTMARVEPAVEFGFSEPPARPSWVGVRPLLEYPTGRRVGMR